MMPALHGEKVRIGAHALQGDLFVPEDATTLVLFVHGSGSSRFSPRNQFVAEVLNTYHMATLLFDLLTENEARDRRNVFDIDLLARRVGSAIAWVEQRSDLADLPLGLFGASTGAAAALDAASSCPGRVSVVVSRGGRPDLSQHLGLVVAPTLLIVGGLDEEVLALNKAALAQLNCLKRLEVVPGATHLFEEPGALESVAHLAGDWFERHVPGAHRS
jgi:pimeloyl-ACP methyl ester carboxylesterase